MNKDEILVLRPLYQMKDYDCRAIAVRLDISEQLKHSKVITIPFGWKVVTKPADTKIKFAEKPEDISTPWEFVDNELYSPFDGSKEKNLICSECRRKITRWNEDMIYCHYCGKRHYFDKEK